MFYQILRLLLLVLVEKSMPTPTPCNTISKPYIDEQMLIDNNPMTVHYTSWNTFECCTTAWFRPEIGETGYNLSCIAITRGVANNVQLTLLNNNIWDVTFCATGMRGTFPTIFVDFEGKNRAFCVALCGPDGGSYTYTVCWGKTANDKILIKQFIEQNGIPGMIDAQLGCNLADNACKTPDKLTN
ncbi:hypothetical protein CHUAL_005118 [Chamberlinius hualienensis]